MSGRLPAGRGRAVPSWSVAPAASGSPPLSAGLSRLFRSGTTPLALSRPPPVSGSIAAKMALAAMFSRSPGRVGADVAAEDVVAVAEGDGTVDVGAVPDSRCVAGHDAVGQFHEPLAMALPVCQ